MGPVMRAGSPEPLSSGNLARASVAESPPAASSVSRRALGVDVARAVALIGMIAVHVFPEENADGQMSWAFGIFGGRAAALFAVLAGVSIAFVERRSHGQLSGRTLAADRMALVVRGLLILWIGLLLGYLGAIVTIIPYFGVLFLLVVPFYGRSSGFLLLAVPVFAIGGPVLRHLFAADMPERPNDTVDYTVATATSHPLVFVTDMLLAGDYPALLWMVYVCVGIVIGRQTLTSRKLALVLAGWGTVLAATTWAISKLLLGPAGGLERLVAATPDLTRAEIVEQLAYGPEDEVLPDTTWWWLTAISPYSNTPLNLLHNLGAAVAALGIVLLLTHRGGRIFTPFAAMGAMTLTLYSAHCVVEMLEVLDEDRPVVALWIQVIAFMLFAVIWRNSVGRGPLETIISDASDWVRTRVGTPRNKTREETPGREKPGSRRKTAADSGAT